MTRVGRVPTNEIVLENPLVSGHHAEVRWTGTYWELRDLGSRNGTFLGGVRLESGGRARLVQGSEVAFGEPTHGLVLRDEAGPRAVAVSSSGGVSTLR